MWLLHSVKAWIVVATAAVASGFPSGAPLSACGHLMPIHEDAVAQKSASPYLLLLSHTDYTKREPITRTLHTSQIGSCRKQIFWKIMILMARF